MRFHLSVVDIAGTTVAVTDVVADALRTTLREVDVEAPAELIATARGRSKLEAIGTILRAIRPDLDAKSVAAERHERFKALLLEAIERGLGPIEGALETIEWLRDRDVAVALTTGFDRAMTDAVLGRLGWMTGVADVVLCADDVDEGRPAPDLIHSSMERTGVRDPAQVLVVGDTTADLEAARRARAGLAVGVLTGAHGRREFAAYRDAVILPSIADLPAHLERGAS